MLMLYVTYLAKNLGTTRTSKNVTAAQARDIELYIDNESESYLYKAREFTGEQVLYDELFTVKQPNTEILNSIKGESYFLVAYLSSLGRNSGEISLVIDRLKGRILVAELPKATAEELKVYAKLEGYKKHFMGIRSKAGIARAKKQGKAIGGLRAKTQKRNEEKSKEADDMAASLKSYIQMFKERDFTLEQSATLLNELGVKTAQGKAFKPMTIKRYIDRVNKA